MSVRKIDTGKRNSTKKRSKRGRSKSAKSSRLVLRYVFAIVDMIRKNKLKLIFLGLVTIALVLTFNSPLNGAGNNPKRKEDKDYLFNQKVQFDYDDTENDPSYLLANDDSTDYSNGEDFNNNNNEMTGALPTGDSTGTIVHGDEHQDEDDAASSSADNDTEFYTMNEDDKKIDIRIQETREKWSKSQFAKDHPNVKFEDTITGATAKSMARHGYKPKAALVMWITDFDIKEVVKTINSVQTIYNNWLQYPWILISADGDEYNDLEWMEGLKESVLFNDMEDETKIFLQIATKEYFEVPDWIDLGKVAQSRNRMRLIEHGDSMKYRQWTRYFTGFLATEKFMSKIDWIWNLKPGTELLCDVDYDLFRKMQDTQKLIGIAGTRVPEDVTQENVRRFHESLKKDHPEMMAISNLEKLFLKRKDDKDKDKNKGDQYESCELLIEDLALLNLNVLRSQTYQDFYSLVDKDANIFHNGWSIETIHSMAFAYFIKKDQFQFFDHLGFQSDTYTNCPINDDVYKEFRCKCDQGGDMTFSKKACSRKIFEELRMSLPDNWDKHKDILKK